MHYSKFLNKTNYVSKKSKTPPGMCRHCNKEIPEKERMYFSGGIIKRECKPCVRYRSNDNNNKKNKILKNNPLW